MGVAMKPAGRPIPELNVTVCLAENYAHAVIANLVANLDDGGRLRLDREPAPVGDCIVLTRMGNAEKWDVVLGERWLPARDYQHALDIVAVARAVAKEAA